MKHSILIAALAPVLSFAALSVPALAQTTAVSGSTATSEARWFGDYDEAVAVAKAEGKDLFVDFTGSDWCHFCIQLDKEVLAHDAWIEAASQDYVFVALDFPRGDEAKALVPNPERNKELMEKHGVKGFPTIFLMTADGVPFAKTGYEEGGPEAYLAHMSEISAAGKKAMGTSDRAAAAFVAAEGDEAKWSAWDALVVVFNGLSIDSPFTAILDKHVRWGFDTDADDAAGKKTVAAKALLSKGVMDEAVLDFARASDAENEGGLLEIVVQAQFTTVRSDEAALAAVAALENINALGFRDQTIGFSLNARAARWFDGPLGDDAQKVVFAKKALAIGSDDPEMIAMLNKLIG